LGLDALDLRPQLLDLFADLIPAGIEVAFLVETRFDLGDLVFDVLEIALEAADLVLKLVGLPMEVEDLLVGFVLHLLDFVLDFLDLRVEGLATLAEIIDP